MILRSAGLILVSCMLQVFLGPGILPAADGRRAIEPYRVIISGLRGEVTITTADPSKELKPVRFRDPVRNGDVLNTGLVSQLELLIGRVAVITLSEETTIQMLEEASGQTVLQLTKGEARLAVARTEEVLTVQTPATAVSTRGGLMRLKVVPGKRQAMRSYSDSSARVVPVAFSTAAPAATPSGLESFQVVEGAAQVKSAVRNSSPVTVDAGQQLQVSAGVIGKPLGQTAAIEPLPLPATDTHTRPSENGVRYLAAQQRQQAEGLQRVLLGPSDSEPVLIKNAATGAILSTTGVIISTTGGRLVESQESLELATLFGPGSVFTSATLTPRTATGTGLVDDSATGDIEFRAGTTRGRSFSVKGGGGLLVFDQHSIQARSELVAIDSGDRRLAPHDGIPPSGTMFVTPSPQLPATPRLHTGLPIQIPGAETGDGSRAERVNRNAEVFINSASPAPALLEFSRDNFDTPLVPDPGRPAGFNSALVIRGQLDANGNFIELSEPRVNPPANTAERSLVDGVIRARSDVSGSAAGRTVALTGGVILNNTKLTAAFAQNLPFDPALPAAWQPPPNATRQYFSETGQTESVNGSIIGVIAKKDSTGTLRPALASFSDRLLAVLDGSTLGPDSPATRIGLLSVLDSQVIGPATIRSTRTGENGLPSGVPPLMEIINSNPPLSNPGVAGVQATSAVVVRASGALNGVLPVDRALLEATAPLVAMVNSTMTTSSHFIDLSGAGPANGKGLLSANLVPGDALVRLNGSALTVMGHLLNLSNGASASLTGHLFSLTNGSSLTVNGVLVNLAGNSVFNLTSTSFGVFGPGANILTINNNLCSSGCTAVPGHPALRVAGGGSMTLPEGFIPFALEPGSPVPRVNLGPNAAVFQVSPEAKFNVNPRR